MVLVLQPFDAYGLDMTMKSQIYYLLQLVLHIEP